VGYWLLMTRVAAPGHAAGDLSPEGNLAGYVDRLVLGTRLDVTEDLEDRWAQLGPDDPMAPLLAAYEWLGWLQESVVQALSD